MLNNCFRFAPRDSVPGLISKICGYLKEHPGWSVEELKEVIGDIEASLALGEVSYFTEQDIGYLDLIELYDVGYRFIFVGGQGVYAVMYALEKSDNVVTANGISLGVSDSEFNSLKLVVTGLVNTVYTTENPPPYPVTSVNGYTGEVATLRVDPDDPGIPADPPVPINANTLNGKSADFYATVDGVNRLLEKKADVIIDTSAKAAIHELYAQDGPLEVTLYGQATETGTGDKSPNNPYVISGVYEAMVRTGSKNLLDTSVLSDGTIKNDNGQDIRDDTSVYFVNMIPVIPGESLYFNFGAQRIYQYGADKRWLRRTAPLIIERALGVFVVPNDCHYIQVQVRVGDPNPTYNKDQMQVEYGTTATAYEPYNANVINLPLLPDGAPLMGNRTVDDTVANDVVSGCDKTYTFNGTQNLAAFNAANWDTCAVVFASTTLSDIQGGFAPYSDRFAGRVTASSYTQEYVATHNTLATFMYFSISFERLGISPTKDSSTGVAAIKAYLAANPLKVYYRSTDYTPDKDLRVCRTVRNWKTIALDGAEKWAYDSKYDGFKTFGLNTGSASYNATVVNGVYKCGQLPIVNNVYPMTGNGLLPYNMSGNTFILVRIEGINDLGAFKAYLAERYASGNPIEITFQLAASETYVAGPVVARKPDTLTTDTVTVTGSAETAVTYPCDTKHYIDSQIAAAVALALNS